MAKLLAESGTATGLFDVDAFSRLWPPPPNDPLRMDLALANVRTTAPNFWGAGAQHLVLAWAVENQDQADRLQDALAVPLRVVRLTVAPEELERRLRTRHKIMKIDEVEWHVQRSAELTGILDDNGLDWPVVRNEATPAEVAARVLAAVDGLHTR